MVFSKPIVSFATMLLAAQMVAAGRASDMTEEDLTFVKAPPARGPEVSSWLANKAARPTKTTTKAPTRRTAEAEFDVDEEDDEVGYVVTVEAIPTEVPAAESFDVDEDELSYEEDAVSEDDSTHEEVTRLFARFSEEPSSRSARIIAKSRIVDEDASPFLDEAEDPEDGSWGKRDRPSGGAGYGSGQGKPPGQGQGKPQGQGIGGRPGGAKGPSGNEGGAMGQGSGAHQEGGARGGPQNMKRYMPNYGARNGTAIDATRGPAAASGVKPPGAKPTGSRPMSGGYGNGARGGRGSRATATI